MLPRDPLLSAQEVVLISEGEVVLRIVVAGQMGIANELL